MQDLDLNSEWEEPISLEGRALPSWPQNVFPQALSVFVQELARFTETPIELSSMLALAVIATACHKKYQVEVKEGYREPTNLWTIGILPPASRKSSVYKEITAPLKEWESEQKMSAEPIIRSAESNRKTIEARIRVLRMQAAKTENEEEYDNLQKQIENIENQLPEVPGCPQIWASDVTNEQLGVIMAANGDAMSLLSDEGGIFDIIGGLYSDGQSNIDLLLQSHSGSSARINRGSRPPILMNRAVVTMGLTIQPQVVKKITGNKTFRGRGLLGRFLYVMPKSNIGFRSLDEPPMSPISIEQFRLMIRAILNHPPPNKDTELHTLNLSQESYKEWLRYAKCNERMMGEEIGVLTHITDWAGKLSGAIARIAGLLHVFRYANQSPWEYPISFEDMASAVKIGHVLSCHALAVFELLHEDDRMNMARSIYQWINEYKLEEFSQRDCSRKFRRYKKAELQTALLLLEEAGIVRKWIKMPTIGRSSDMYSVNPKIQGK